MTYDSTEPSFEYTIVNNDDPILANLNECQEYIYDYNEGYQYTDTDYCAL